MKYLLDVNVLVALGLSNHTLHFRVNRWVQANTSTALATCSITELGFVRIISQASLYGLTVAEARSQLLQLKKQPKLSWEFLADDQDIARLPSWVKTGKQTTDGHLVQLAMAHGALLATLDAKIPGAFVLP